MSDNIKEVEGGWQVIGLDGEELDNSPYETETKAKQGFNAHKLNFDGDVEDDLEDDGDEDQEEDVEHDVIEDKGDKDDKNDDSDSSIMNLLGNKYVIIGAGLLLGWKFYNSDDSGTETVEETEDVEPEESGSENLDDGRKSASEMFV